MTPGPKFLLVGGTGTGKTHSIRTLLDAGIDVGVLFTEPGMEVLADTPPDRCAWHYIPPASVSFTDMLESAKKINTMSFEALTKLPDINKRQHTEFLNLLSAMNNFPNDRTGELLGPVEQWNDKRVFVLDSLSGLNIMAMNLVAGSKPVKSMADWGVAMDNLERFIIKITAGLVCPVVVTAHLERESDELTGGIQLMASTLGRKLAPKIPRFFSDVIHTKRDGTKFTWSTASINVDLKARNLPLADNLPPTFAGLLDKWKQTL